LLDRFNKITSKEIVFQCPRFTLGSTFLPESAGFDFLSRFVLTGTGWNFTQSIDSPSEPFCHNPFFEKAKFRNLEVSRPYSRLNPKFRIPGRPILILNSRLMAHQKMVTAMALWEVNQNRQGYDQFGFYFLLQPENQKWKTLRI